MNNLVDIPDYFYKNKEFIGKILFILSLVLLCYLIFHPMNQHLCIININIIHQNQKRL